MSRAASDRYQFIRHLRSTETSQLYEAVHQHQPGRFLVEVLHGACADDAGWSALERDVLTLSALRHPSIVRVVETSLLPDQTPLLISKLPEGPTLADWLAQSSPPDPELALALVRAVADALESAHGRGVVHGDLSADDIHLTPRPETALGWPRVRGFGRHWLCGPRVQRQDGFEPTAEERAADLAALARLAVRLLAHPAGGQADDESATGFWTNPCVAQVITRATGGGAKGFESPLAFATTLELAARSEEPTPSAGPMATGSRPRISWRSGGLTLTLVGLGLTTALAGLLAAAGTKRLSAFRRWAADHVGVLAAREQAAPPITQPPPPPSDEAVPNATNVFAPRTRTVGPLALPPIAIRAPVEGRSKRTPRLLPELIVGTSDESTAAPATAPHAGQHHRPLPARASGDDPHVHGPVWSPRLGRLVPLDEAGPLVEGASPDGLSVGGLPPER